MATRIISERHRNVVNAACEKFDSGMSLEEIHHNLRLNGHPNLNIERVEQWLAENGRFYNRNMNPPQAIGMGQFANIGPPYPTFDNAPNPPAAANPNIRSVPANYQPAPPPPPPPQQQVVSSSSSDPNATTASGYAWVPDYDLPVPWDFAADRIAMEGHRAQKSIETIRVELTRNGYDPSHGNIISSLNAQGVRSFNCFDRA